MARGPGIVDLARKAEDLGYSALSLADHFGQQWSPSVALAASAVVTNQLRLAPLVWCNDFRHPVVLAKEVASLDELSQGRVELGLGAGWMESDYLESGLSMDPAATRIERMGEALQVIKGLLGPERCQFEGRHYRVDMHGYPKPVQARVPILVGGGGKAMLNLAARQADIVGINLNLRSNQLSELAPEFAAQACEQKVAWVREAGREVEMHMLLGWVGVGPREEMLEKCAQEMETPIAVLRDSPHVLAGSLTEMVEQLQHRRLRWGLSYFTVREQVMEQFAPVVAALT